MFSVASIFINFSLLNVYLCVIKIIQRGFIIFDKVIAHLISQRHKTKSALEELFMEDPLLADPLPAQCTKSDTLTGRCKWVASR